MIYQEIDSELGTHSLNLLGNRIDLEADRTDFCEGGRPVTLLSPVWVLGKCSTPKFGILPAGLDETG